MTPAHFRPGYACTGGNYFLLWWISIFTTVEIDFYHGGKFLISSNEFMTSSEFTQVPPCPDFYHVEFLFFNGNGNSFSKSDGDTNGVEYNYTRGLSVYGFSSL